MTCLNKVILIGRLGSDPEDRMTGGGTRVSSFSMATDRYRSVDGTGSSEKVTDWHRVVAFGKTAEHCNNHLRKGRLACIEGSLQTRTWENPQGTKHRMTEIVAARVTFLDARGKDDSGSNSETADEAGSF